MSTHTTTLNLGGAGEIEKFAMTNCLMIAAGANRSPTDSPAGLSFECKTCGRKFQSFQALGGHRASHNRVKLLNSGESAGISTSEIKKKKIHACAVCGLEFHIGQALGGHMRLHNKIIAAGASTVTTEDSTDQKSDGNDVSDRKRKKNDKLSPARENTSLGKRVSLDIKLNCSEVISVIEEGEIVEKEEKKRDLLKLELRPPNNNYNYMHLQ